MHANSGKSCTFDISLFLKCFQSLRQSIVYFSAYFTRCILYSLQGLTIDIKKLKLKKKKIVNATLGVYLTEDIRPNARLKS